MKLNTALIVVYVDEKKTYKYCELMITLYFKL